LDLLDAAHDGGVVSLEEGADFLIGELQFLAGEIHGHLAGEGVLPRLRFAQNVSGGNPVVGGNLGDDRLKSAAIFCLFFDKIFRELFMALALQVLPSMSIFSGHAGENMQT
jgi:hypothetical protein